MRVLSRRLYQRLLPLYLWWFSQPLVMRFVAPEHLGLEARYSPVGRGINRDMLLQDQRLQSVVVIGADSSGELLLRLRATSDLVACVDLYAKENVAAAALDWERVAERGVGFVVGDASVMPLRDRSVDLFYSESVLEHVQDVEALMKEAARVVRPGGEFAALFGPLWFTHGGPHIGELAYDHLLLSREEFFHRASRIGNRWQVRWIEKDFYNRLTIDDYLAIFRRDFDVELVALAGSPDGRRYARSHPEQWRELEQRHGRRALLTRLVAVRLTRRST